MPPCCRIRCDDRDQAGLVESVVRAVRAATGMPIFAKIVPSVGLAGLIAKKAVEAGADGITAVNTVGPLALQTHPGMRCWRMHSAGFRVLLSRTSH